LFGNISPKAALTTSGSEEEHCPAVDKCRQHWVDHKLVVVVVVVVVTVTVVVMVVVVVAMVVVTVVVVVVVVAVVTVVGGAQKHTKIS
jgi:hypothetical protein